MAKTMGKGDLSTVGFALSLNEVCCDHVFSKMKSWKEADSFWWDPKEQVSHPQIMPTGSN